MQYRLSVSYETDPEIVCHRDDEAELIAGREPVGSGVLLEEGRRDLEFHFDSQDAAWEARDEFLRSGFQAAEIRETAR